MLHAQYIITPGHESFDEGLTLFVNGVHHENWEGCKGILMSCSKSRDIFLPSPSVAGPRATSRLQPSLSIDVRIGEFSLGEADSRVGRIENRVNSLKGCHADDEVQRSR